jgi:hypothetical protein
MNKTIIIYKSDNITIVMTPTLMVCSVKECQWKCEQCKVGREAIKAFRRNNEVQDNNT